MIGDIEGDERAASTPAPDRHAEQEAATKRQEARRIGSYARDHQHGAAPDPDARDRSQHSDSDHIDDSRRREPEDEELDQRRLRGQTGDPGDFGQGDQR